ncbi:MAG TPA: hypothetical protein VH063_15455 [Gaiellaceae bacterium]|jgi:hypothetical protein|nr:hypothetical protein [Gaiellaceae bacterium]
MRLTLAASVAVLAALVAGVGGSTAAAPNGVELKTAGQILTASRAAVAQAATVHIVGTIADKGGPITLNLKLINSKVGVGRLSVGGATFNIIRIGNTLYLKADRKFLEANGGAAAVKVLAGRWFKVSTAVHDFKDIAPLTDLVQLVDAVLGTHGKLALGSHVTIGGRPAIALVDTSEGGTLYVATTGPPYPLELKGTKGQGEIKFESWDTAVTVLPPTNALDFSKVTGG